MAKYLISRLLIVFLVKFFYSWGIHAKAQLIQFFDFHEGFMLSLLSYLIMFIIFCLGLFVINLSFSILHLTDRISFNEIIEKIKQKGFLKSIKTYLQNFWSELRENFEIETRIEKYPTLFIIFVLVFLPFSKGNPILKNYYGIYTEYEIPEQGRYGERSDYVEEQNIIIHKSKINEIKSIMKFLEEDIDDSYVTVKKRGYLFIQAGLIDGYGTYYEEYEGFFAYLECVLFSAVEKLINTIMYFFIPFILCVIIYHYKFE